MNIRVTAALLSVLLCAVRTAAAENYAEVAKKAAADYGERLLQATDELNRTRGRIANEHAPLLKQMRAAEDRVIAAESQIQQFETGQEEAAERRRKLLKNIDAARKTTAYIGTLVRDGAKVFADGLVPGETQVVSDSLQALQQKLDEPSAGSVSARPAVDLAEMFLDRTEHALGGYTAPGRAVIANGREVVAGTFAFVGPATYFRPASAGPAGAVWTGTSATFPVSQPLPGWNAGDVADFFEGRPGKMVADVSGGKALRLQETKGSVRDHLNAGGLVAYLIVGVGLLALLLVGQKIRDLARMNLDTPGAVEAFLAVVEGGSPAGMEQALTKLKGTTHELFSVGVRQFGQPREILDERLQAAVMRQQQHYERRLPLLAVIATAAPLMGLLGTVVGMVRTFALITVFGTGNAAKLASGISQVLVATELGLMVAIPTLIAHGFLAHRIHRNVARLERHAQEFVTAAEVARSGAEVNGGAGARVS